MKRLAEKSIAAGFVLLCASVFAAEKPTDAVKGILNPLDEQTATQTAAVAAQNAADVPALLKGIWYNSERYVLFDTGYKKNDGSIPQIVLRMFYTWYDDRAAEAADYTAKTGSKTVNVSGADTSVVASTTSRYFSSTNTATSGSARNLTYATRINNQPSEPENTSSQKHENIPAEARDVNNTTDGSPAQEIKVKFVPLVTEAFPASYNIEATVKDGMSISADTIPSGAWDLQIVYPHDRTVYHVPAAVIGNNLYLHFTVKAIPREAVSSDGVIGFWQDYGNASGILISAPYTSRELLSYYITQDSVYHIRYWQTDMEYNPDAEAVFSDGDKTYTVKKHLYVGDRVYTCVNGRGTKIRNIEKSKSLPEAYTLNKVNVDRQVVNEDGSVSTVRTKCATICALGEPYLTLTDGKQSIEQIVVQANNRRMPPPKPVFPPSNLDFHWDIIKDLNKYNRLLSYFD